jgi:hypothetical protein
MGMRTKAATKDLAKFFFIGNVWLLSDPLARFDPVPVHRYRIGYGQDPRKFHRVVSGLLIIKFVTNTSEGDPGRDLRTVHNSFETEIVLLEVTTESPVTDLSKDGTS